MYFCLQKSSHEFDPQWIVLSLFFWKWKHESSLAICKKRLCQSGPASGVWQLKSTRLQWECRKTDKRVSTLHCMRAAREEAAQDLTEQAVSLAPVGIASQHIREAIPEETDK